MAVSDHDVQAVAEALYAVESRHHIYGHTCLCGFSSAVSRDRTAHIARLTVYEALGVDLLVDATRALDGA